MIVLVFFSLGNKKGQTKDRQVKTVKNQTKQSKTYQTQWLSLPRVR
jgi:hypothetical protein